MTRWEYDIVPFSGRNTANVISELDRKGAQGWEAIGLAPIDHFGLSYGGIIGLSQSEIHQTVSAMMVVLLKRVKG